MDRIDHEATRGRVWRMSTPRRAAPRQSSIAAALAVVALLGALASPGHRAEAETPRQLPPFTHAAADWINAEPPGASGLRGHPLLLEVWTFECSNCLASLPWVRRIAAQYRPRGLAVVGVHSPESGEERDHALVAAAVRRLGIDYPVMLDDDFSYWRALQNRYWPAFYLYDAQGRLVATRVGELHTGEPGAEEFERLIAGLCASPGTGR